MIFEHGGYKILVVDDVLANVLLLKVMLEQDGYKVVTASGAKEALVQLREEQPDLLLLDVLMPEMNGFELAKGLKELPEYHDLPIIFLTALDKPSEVAEGFRLGGSDFISKPFNKQELLARVKYQVSLIVAKRTIMKQTEILRKTIEGRDKLYSVIAHDLRSPMSAMKMILNVLCYKIDSDTVVNESLLEELRSANQIAEELFLLLDNLLKWTRSQLGLLVPIFQSYDLVELVRGLQGVFDFVAKQKNIVISLKAPQKMYVTIDIDMIKTVIRNILNNAIKYSYAGGTIEIAIYEQDQQAVIDVQDHGCGISEENQSKLLAIKTHYSTFGTNHEEGSGLGLLLANDFLTLNKGKLSFVSKEGVGSTFTVKLPTDA